VIKGMVRVGAGTQPQTCNGGRVYLMPDTPVFEAKLASANSGAAPEELGLEDDKLDHVVRRTQCDLIGQFYFDGLPEANWILLTAVSLPKGAVGPTLAAHVATQSGKLSQITLDQSNFVKK
jgi:hypothetical protein